LGSGSLSFGRALVDSGADDTVFPLDIVSLLAVTLLPVTGHALRWRGQSHALRYGRVELELVDDTGSALRWPATVAFTPAPIRYPLLGVTGCLEYFNARFLGNARTVELEPNEQFPTSPVP
jgi:hypothetical protein